MKKLLFAFTSFALATSAYAQEGADIKWNAELRMRMVGNENAPTGKSSWDNSTEQRTKIGATMTKGDDLTATVTLLNAGTWGNDGVTNTSGDMTQDGDQGVYVYEAFAFWKAMDNFALKIGRGALDLADGSVVAKNDWEQTPYSFEGAYGAYFTEWANIGVFGVKGMNDDAANTADVNFYGLSVDFKNLPEVLKMLNFHVLQSKATGIDPVGAVTEAKDTKTRYGVTAKGDVAGFDYRATYAMYTGELEVQAPAPATSKSDHKASMLDAEVGYSLPDVMNMRIHALYHMDSGDDNLTGGDSESYDPFFYEKHSNAGLMDIVGWGNSTYIKVGVALEPVEATTVGADYYMFSKSEKNDFIYDNSHANALGGATNVADDDVGTELDVWAKRTLSNGTILNARLGLFQAGDAWGTAKEDVTAFEVGATFRF